MQANEPVAPPTPSGTVRGLGTSDVLRLDLLPSQLPRLIDELGILQGVLEDAVEHAGQPSQSPNAREEHEYELHLLRLMQTRVPSVAGQERVAFAGPSGLIGELVTAALRSEIEDLAAVAEHVTGGAESRARLREATAAANAWVQTYLDLKEVEGFSFDGEADPYRAW